MSAETKINSQTVARWTGWSLIATILVGALSAFWVADGIDINLTADVSETAENMLAAETRLRARAYIALLTFGLGIVVSVGFFLLLKRFGMLLAGWSLAVSLAASAITLLGAVTAMNAAHISSYASEFAWITRNDLVMLTAVQATTDYTSFHLTLVLSSISSAGFYLLFLKSRLIPKLIAGWGLFASCFVAGAIVARDFIPAIGSEMVTGAFMLSNLVALVSTGLYLGIRGIRQPASPTS